MHAELINRVIGLVKKHGDKVVLMDEKTGEAVVVLGLEAYERLVGTGMGRDQLVQPVNQLAAQPIVEAAQQAPIAPQSQPVTQQQPSQHQQQRQPEERRGHAKGLTTEEVMAAVGERPAQSQPVNPPPTEPKPPAVNDEERFYLEPIE